MYIYRLIQVFSGIFSNLKQVNNISSITDKQVIEFINFVCLIVDRISYLKGYFDRETFSSFGKYIKKLEVYDIESEYYYHKNDLLKESFNHVGDEEKFVGKETGMNRQELEGIKRETSILNDVNEKDTIMQTRKYEKVLSKNDKTFAHLENSDNLMKQIESDIKTMGYNELWELSLANIDIYLNQESRFHSEISSLADAILRFSRVLPDDKNSSINFSSSELISKFVQFLSNNQSNISETDKVRMVDFFIMFIKRTT
jgi:hypothetical protein